MKNLFTLFAFVICFASQMNAQSKHYPLLEHFTNSKCGVCASKNPGFYTQFNNLYASKVNHMTVHPKVPYSTCPIYLAAKTASDTRQAFYSVGGTPRIYLDGKYTTGPNLVNTTEVDNAIAASSPISIKVTETGTNPRTVNIEVSVTGTVPSGSYVIQAAACEKTLNLNGGNGELTHHNVMRSYLFTGNGEAITLNPNSTQTFTKTVNFDASWKESEMYIIAFVQQNNTKEILNSGSKFNITTDVNDPADVSEFQIVQNPVRDHVKIQLSHPIANGTASIFTMDGKLVAQQLLHHASGTIEIPVSTLATGVYVLELSNGARSKTQQFQKN